ncbi:MAG: hypothetical protein JSR59_15225 [Proteobacteria bacterium]|nr:hypothetical protein [Pseudomonadota bacterium]
MVARLSALVVWALVAASAVFWGLRLTARPPQAPPYTVGVGDGAVARADLTRLFGAPAVAEPEETIAPDAAARYQLLGVIAPKPPKPNNPFGVALIAVDGQPPKAYKVGASLEDDLVLQSVGLRTAAVGPADGKAAFTLELPAPQPAATGTLPPPGVAGINGVPGTVAPAAPIARGIPPGMRRPNGLPFQPGVQPQQIPQPVQQPMQHPTAEPMQMPNMDQQGDQSPTPAD